MTNEWEDIFNDVISKEPASGINRYTFDLCYGFEYKIMRRKKEKPMPTILPGDKVVSLSSHYIVFDVINGRVCGWTPEGRWSNVCIYIEDIKKIEREGKVIWER